MIVRKNDDLVHGYIIPLSIALFLALFASLAIVSVWFKRRTVPGEVLVADLAQLGRIFTKIDQTARIAGFDHQKNWINFLQIKKEGFTGSEVGPMNLVYPDKWQGPYLEENPTFYGKEYQVVRTDQGYFIVPGEGTRLPNGKLMGKDIVINEDTDVFKLMKDKDGLMFEDVPLAVKIAVGGDKEVVGVPTP